MIRRVVEKAYTKATGRSSQWPKESKAYLAENPQCVVCGGKATEVHHEKPFHMFKDLEMDKRYWHSVCRNGPGGLNCHCVVGHGGDFKSYNPHFVRDAERMQELYQGTIRPMKASMAASGFCYWFLMFICSPTNCYHYAVERLTSWLLVSWLSEE